MRPVPTISLVDMGSRSGSYLRVHKDVPRRIETESYYMIGGETHFHVL
jgi:hypothetical protein